MCRSSLCEDWLCRLSRQTATEAFHPDYRARGGPWDHPEFWETLAPKHELIINVRVHYWVLFPGVDVWPLVNDTVSW